MVDQMTFIYCQPAVLNSAVGRVEVDLALASLAAKLDLDPDGPLRGHDSGSVTIPGVSPTAAWAAMDCVLDRAAQRQLFLCPEF